MCVVFKHSNLKYQIMLHVLKTFFPFTSQDQHCSRHYLYMRIMIICAYSEIEFEDSFEAGRTVLEKVEQTEHAGGKLARFV